MRRLSIGLSLLLIISLGSWWMYKHFMYAPKRPSLWQNLPMNYLFVAYTPSFSQMWRSLRRNSFTEKLARTPQFSVPFAMAHQWDSVIHTSEEIKHWLTGHALLIAIYPEGTLFLMDAPFLEDIGDWRGTMEKIATKNGWKVEIVEYNGYSLWKIGRGYLAPAGKILAYSEEPKLLSRFLLGENISILPESWGNAIIEGQSSWLILTTGQGLHQLFPHPLLTPLLQIDTIQAEVHLSEEALQIRGRGVISSGTWPYLTVSPPQLADLCPPSVSAFVSFRIKDPVMFFNSLIQPHYQAEIRQAEKSLGISFSESFFSQITGEVGLIQEKEPYVIYHLRQNAPFTVLPQEKVLYHHGYTIKQVRAEGLFRWLHGEAFSKWTSPYMVQVGEWVLFAQSPAPLYSWLDALVNRQSLYNRSDFSIDVPARAIVYAFIDAKKSSWIETWAPPKAVARWQKDFEPFSALYVTIEEEDSLHIKIDLRATWRGEEENTIAQDTSLPKKLNITFTPKKDSTSDGPQEEYYPNGVVKRRFTLIDGQMEGEYTEYHPNGIVKVRGFYEQGQKVGKWIYFNSKGEKLREETWSSESEPLNTPGVP
ncbi:MAG: hypothetical protein NZZ60_05825 [Bacteroidia bacterium]|nr:hypothetical protein [Bacteroidia bacterium]MCX7652255.1 hypothetical protein [Bacteroidia bacterium]